MDRDAMKSDQDDAPRALPQRQSSTAAQRALDEASARRKAERDREKEIGGRGGLDPVRFGDWEVKGLASDF